MHTRQSPAKSGDCGYAEPLAVITYISLIITEHLRLINLINFSL